MSNQDKEKIVEWLYLNDQNFNSKIEWRKKFIEMLNSLVIPVSCLCSSGSALACPIHQK